MKGLDYLIWNLRVETVGPPHDPCEWYGFEATTADGTAVYSISENQHAKKRRAFQLLYFGPEYDGALIVAESVATVGEGKAIAQRHHRIMAIAQAHRKS